MVFKEYEEYALMREVACDVQALTAKEDEFYLQAAICQGCWHQHRLEHSVALKHYFKALKAAIAINDYKHELLAYDLLAKAYYYLDDIDYSIFFHEKSIIGRRTLTQGTSSPATRRPSN